MNIFFKLLAIGGFGGTVAGAFYLSKQEYTNNHVASEESSSTSSVPSLGFDVKRQPVTKLNPTKPDQPEKVTK